MTVLLDAEIEGSGQFNFGGAEVQYVLVELDVLGPQVFIADVANPDHLAQAGWFALGSRSSFATSAEHVFWQERKWINYKSFQWHPEPTRDHAAAADLSVWASDVRWRLSVGTHGLMLVIGY
jgi:hypothetical protein